MNTYKFLSKALLIVLITLPQLLSADPWKKYVTEEQREFCKEQLAPVLKLYHEGNEDEALKALDKAYDLAETTYTITPYNRVHFFHRIIWWEAQIRTGRTDPDWGLKLYEYLYNRDVLKDGEIKIIPPAEFCLIQNIMEGLQVTGRAAEARAWLLHMEDNILTYRGLNTTNTSVYADLGPIFSFMPEARKREFPLYAYEVPEFNVRNKTYPIYYPYLDAIYCMANHALSSGDWAHAAELYSWYIAYNDMYISTKSNQMRSAIFRNNLDAITALGSICSVHDHPEETIAMYDKAIEQADQYLSTHFCIRQYAELYREVAKINLGLLTEESMAIVDHAVDKLSAYHFFTRSDNIKFQMLRARVYHALGHKEEAWSFVNELFENTQQDINPYLWTYMLGTMIDLAIDDGATHPELESWLTMALSNERLKGNKFGELDLYEDYATFLKIHGRNNEAIQIQQEALRLSKAMNLNKRAEKNQAELDTIIALQKTDKKNPAIEKTEEPAEKMHPAPETVWVESTSPKNELSPTTGGTAFSQNSGVDIQPSQSVAVSLNNQPAYGRLYLYNPAVEPQTGTLRFSGAIEDPTWQNDNWLTIGASPELPDVQQDEVLAIPAGACCVVDLTAIPEASGNQTAIRCEWIPSDPNLKSTVAEWNYSTAPNKRRTAVIDAHAVQENPFYLIPVHHMIQRMKTGKNETIDFSIEASTPMRIEMYNGETDELIAIDANGDGDFKDPGDYIGVDDNRNSQPDITFGTQQKLTSLLLYIKPDHQTSKSEAELIVKIRDNNEWRTDAIDRIEFK